MTTPLTPRCASMGWPLRRTLLLGEGAVSAAAAVGVLQLLAGIATPPPESLPPGLGDWTLPALWLFGTVTVPSAAAAYLAFRRSARAPQVALAATCLLLLEVIVQIPFLGLNVLQPVVALAGLGLAWTALRARRLGWDAA